MNRKPNPLTASNFVFPESRGFTLVELLISLAVISLLAGVAGQTFRAVLDAREAAIKRLEINETGRSALNFISNELRSAYLTPDSVAPFDPSSEDPLQGPRFRFAGIYRDVELGDGEDGDGDGDVDEEILNGIDDDRDDEVDEDVGQIPSDVLHFVSAVENGSDVTLQEVSYGLNPSGTRLVRRAQNLNLSSNSPQEIANFGQFIDNQSGERLLPPVVPPGSTVSGSAVSQALDAWNRGAQYGRVQSSGDVLPGNAPGKIFQVLAYDIRGLRLRYWYYDYNRGGWRWANEWDSTQETALLPPSENIFNQPAANNSIEGGNRVSFANLIVNEPDDMYPRAAGSEGFTRFLITNPARLLSPEFNDTLQRIVRRTDGLPNMVEITLYVQDRERELEPRPFTSRVFIPNNYRSIGL